MTAPKRIAHRHDAPAVSRRKLLYVSVVGAVAANRRAGRPDGRWTPAPPRSRSPRKESPTFGGYSWPGVGQYEKIIGTAYGELDPNDPHNAVIVDIKLAPRNAAGKVEYSHNFYILKPIDLAKGNHKVVYDAVNRGSKTFSVLQSRPQRRRPGIGDGRADVGEHVPVSEGVQLRGERWDASAGTDPRTST
jgi:hypothetical protein